MDNQKSYSQFRAMLAVTVASLRSTFRSPSAVLFSFAFPMFFILVFGFIGKGTISVKVGVSPKSDTTNAMYAMLKSRPELKLVRDESEAQMKDELERGKLDGILEFGMRFHDTRIQNLFFFIGKRMELMSHQLVFATDKWNHFHASRS